MKIGEALKVWFVLAVVTTVLSGLIYLAVQQSYRQSANDPQIQMAEDGAAALENGSPIQNIIPTQIIDLSKSLAPFVMIFDNNGQVIASSAKLDNQIPPLPAGVFNDAKNKELRFTWQPEVGVREAVVMTHFNGPTPGYILAGRSLREVEVRVDELTKEIAFGLITALSSSLIFSLLLGSLRFKK